jgi:hypothetical protein
MRVSCSSRLPRLILATVLGVVVGWGGTGMSARAGQATDRADAGARTMQMFDGPAQMEMLPLSGLEPSWSEVQRVYHTLSAAQIALAPFRDVPQAQKAGYRPASPLFSMGEGVHYLNQMYLPGTKRAVDPAAPPVLVYNQAGGKLTLAGVMYVMPAAATPQQLDAVFPRSMATWHRRINTCVVGGAVVRIHTQSACAAARGGMYRELT